MPLTCAVPDCTLAETGMCLLDNDPMACSERLALDDRQSNVERQNEYFPPSRACTLRDARR